MRRREERKGREAMRLGDEAEGGEKRNKNSIVRKWLGHSKQ